VEENALTLLLLSLAGAVPILLLVLSRFRLGQRKKP
jgi:hypothetical protein